jgi:signal transduction histidine kinase
MRIRNSLATRLFLSAAFWSLFILVIAGVILSTVQQRVSERAFDDRLAIYLKSLVADVASPNDADRSDPSNFSEPRFDLPLSGWYWQVTRLDRLPPEIRSSVSLFGGKLPMLSTDITQSGTMREGYVTGPDEQGLRMVEQLIDLGDDGRFLIQVAAPADTIADVVRRFRMTMIVTFVLLGLALVITTVFQVRFGLRPLRDLRQEIGAIRTGQTQRIAGTYPDELSPLAQELNLLIDSNEAILERARTQVGNLAHALKTPLSVIVNESEDEDTALANKVREQAALMRDQVNWYLERARAAARAGTLGSVTEIAPVVAGLVRAFEKIYRDRELHFEIAIPDGLRFRGERQDLEEMAGNLMDNAGKWARSRIHVTACLTADGFAEIVVADDGPGLPAEARHAVLTRGKRLDESKPGSGLGLSIVADLAALYGGSLALDDSPEGGLAARLRIPAIEGSSLGVINV